MMTGKPVTDVSLTTTLPMMEAKSLTKACMMALGYNIPSGLCTEPHL